MPVQKIKQFLDEHKVKYTIISHSAAYTAQEIAESAHIPGRELAKTVVVDIDDKKAMVVQPATSMVNLGRLKKAIGATHVSLAEEKDFQTLFPDCEVGAMPPFGKLYGMDVYVSESLTLDDEIAFNAGSHTELIRLAYSDFASLVEPKVVSF